MISRALKCRRVGDRGRIGQRTNLACLGHLAQLLQALPLRSPLQDPLVLLRVDVQRLVVLQVDRRQRLRRLVDDVHLLVLQLFAPVAVIVLVVVVSSIVVHVVGLERLRSLVVLPRGSCARLGLVVGSPGRAADG